MQSFQRALNRRRDGDQNLGEAEPFSGHGRVDDRLRPTDAINGFSTEALDRLGRGLFVVTRSAILLFANRTAGSLLGNGLRLHQCRLTAQDRVQSETLHRLVLAAARHSAAGSLIVTGADARDILLSVIPVCGIPRCSHGERPEAMLISKELKPAACRHLDGLSRHYGLTAAETRVAGALLLGGGITGVAQRLNISEATARTHLARVFQKTGAGRQAQLVGLIPEGSDGIINSVAMNGVEAPARA